jgi:hypothetical protein
MEVDIDLGRCIVCHRDRDHYKFKMCSACRLRARGYAAKYNANKLKGGLKHGKNTI